MNRNFIFNDVNEALPQLMGELLVHGDEFGSRAGRTKELMHVGITLNQPWRRELVLSDRKANVAAQIVETMWVLSGRNDIATLTPYLPRATDFSDDGATWRAGYGPRLRSWYGEGRTTDQLDYVVNTLRSSPGSRQAVMSIWDPSVDTTPGKDIACNNWLSFSSRLGKLDLHVAIRSNDAMWGWSGINAFEWSALLEIVAGLCGLQVGKLHFSITSFHLYDQHWAKAQRIANNQQSWLFDDSPRFKAQGMDTIARFDDLASHWWAIEEDIREGRANQMEVDAFPEPMLRSWLRVLQWYWSDNDAFLSELRHTRLAGAALVGVKPAGSPKPTVREPAPEDGFVHMVSTLHRQKHEAYGDSWKRRGEYMILANIARKVDRLEGGGETDDETQADTAIDLLVYLLKYRAWLAGLPGGPEDVDAGLEQLSNLALVSYDPTHELINLFEMLGDATQKASLVAEMLPKAYALARSRWS